MPSRSLRSASERRITVPSQRGTKSLSQTFTLTVPIWWMTCPTQSEQLNPYHLQETAKTHLFIFIWPSNSSTLYSHFIWSNLSSFFFFFYTHLTLYQLHIYSLTASFSCKTNTRLIFSIFYILVFKKKKKKHPSYMYCVRLTRTCNSTCMLLLFCWFWLLL